MLGLVGGRRHLITVLAGFASAIGLAAATGIVLNDEPDQLSVAWWGDGELHIGSTSVRAPMPENLEMVRDGVVYWAEPVYGLEPQPVVFVDRSGTVRKVGTKSWPSPLAADPDGSTAAWVEATRETKPQLVVFDTAENKVIAERPLMKRGPRWSVLDEGSFPIAIDNDRVYYAAQDGDYLWDFRRDDPPRRIDKPSAYLRAYRAGVSITNAPYNGPPKIAARGSTSRFPDDVPRRISPDGRLAGGVSIDGDIVLWDVEAQRQLETGQTAQRPVVDLSFDREGRIVVARATKINPAEYFGDGMIDGIGLAPRYGPPFDIAVCSVKPVCTTVPGSKSKTRPVLAK